MDFLSKSISKFLLNIANDTLGILSDISRDKFESAAKVLLENGAVGRIHNIMVSLSIALIIFFCTKRYFDVYIMESSGDSDSDPMDILINGSRAVAITTTSSWLFATYMNFTVSLVRFVLDQVGENGEDYTVTLSGVVSTVYTNVVSFGLTWTIFLVVIIVGLLIFMVIGFLRAIDLMLMYILYPIFCAELVFTSHERYNGIVTNIVVTSCYYLIQLICFYFLIQSILHGMVGIDDTTTNILGEKLITLAWLIACIRSPKWLEKFVYTTGIGDKINRGAGMLGRGLGNLGSMIVSKKIS